MKDRITDGLFPVRAVLPGMVDLGHCVQSSFPFSRPIVRESLFLRFRKVPFRLQVAGNAAPDRTDDQEDDAERIRNPLDEALFFDQAQHEIDQEQSCRNTNHRNERVASS